MGRVISIYIILYLYLDTNFPPYFKSPNSNPPRGQVDSFSHNSNFKLCGDIMFKFAIFWGWLKGQVGKAKPKLKREKRRNRKEDTKKERNKSSEGKK